MQNWWISFVFNRHEKAIIIPAESSAEAISRLRAEVLSGALFEVSLVQPLGTAPIEVYSRYFDE